VLQADLDYIVDVSYLQSKIELGCIQYMFEEKLKQKVNGVFQFELNLSQSSVLSSICISQSKYCILGNLGVESYFITANILFLPTLNFTLFYWLRENPTVLFELCPTPLMLNQT